ncbi:hypothetical protein ASS64_14360 [Erythrobacter sp. AP23]|nr:hypothetical protein ASS64_14360 [Erythrobacter sp. AP23]
MPLRVESRPQHQLTTISLREDITIAANPRKTSEIQLDYRVYFGDVEIGAGWNRWSEASGRDYVSLSFTAPEFGPLRLYANLVPAAGEKRGDRFAIF